MHVLEGKHPEEGRHGYVIHALSKLSAYLNGKIYGKAFRSACTKSMQDIHIIIMLHSTETQT